MVPLYSIRYDGVLFNSKYVKESKRKTFKRSIYQVCANRYMIGAVPPPRQIGLRTFSTFSNFSKTLLVSLWYSIH